EGPLTAVRFDATRTNTLSSPPSPPCRCGELPPSHQLTAYLGQGCPLHNVSSFAHKGRLPAVCVDAPRTNNLCAPQCPLCLCGEVPPSNQMTACLGQACALHDIGSASRRGRLPAVGVDAPRTNKLCAPQCPLCLCGEVPASNQMTACLGQACVLHDHSTFPHKGRLPAVCVDALRTNNLCAPQCPPCLRGEVPPSNQMTACLGQACALHDHKTTRLNSRLPAVS